MIVGIGVDAVDIARFEEVLGRTPGMRERLFTARELVLSDGAPRPTRSLAARFAAKEAVAKALGAPRGLHWHDCEVWLEPSGQPQLELRGTVAAAAAAAGAQVWHVSLSHDAGIAVASVMAETAAA